jgi:hypothetical protein
MPHRSPAAAILICPIPRGTSVAEVAAWMARSRGSNVPVTWTVDLETLATAREAAADTVPDLAIDLTAVGSASRRDLRETLRSARQAWPHCEGAILRGPAALDHRDALVQEGITTIAVDHFDACSRGSRRPAPRGWPCRSMLWGLWEVSLTTPARSGVVGQMTDWCLRGGRTAGLTVLDAGGSNSLATVRSRFDRHLAWIRRKATTGLRAVTLSAMPAVLRGGIDAAAQGSVLRAA